MDGERRTPPNLEQAPDARTANHSLTAVRQTELLRQSGLQRQPLELQAEVDERCGDRPPAKRLVNVRALDLVAGRHA